MSIGPNFEDAGEREPHAAGDPTGAFGAGPRPGLDLWHRATRQGALSKSAAVGLAAIAIVLLLAGVELFLAERLRDLRDQTNQLQRQIASVEQRVGRLELQMEQQLSRRVPEAGQAPARPEGDAAPAVAARPDSAIALTRTEIDIVREYIKLPPAAAGAAATMSIGTAVGPHLLVAFPGQITDRVPKLIGARFATDRNGAIVVVAAGSDRVGFIIPPS